MRDQGQWRGWRNGMGCHTFLSRVRPPPLAGAIIALHPWGIPFRANRPAFGRPRVGVPHGKRVSFERRIVARRKRGTGRRGAGDREGGFACRHGRPGRSSGPDGRADKHCPSRRPSRTAGRQAASPPPTEVAAGGGGRGRTGGRGTLPDPVGGDGPEYREHGRRLRERPRDHGGPPGIRPGGQGTRGRQLPREERGPAGPARQGAQPGSGRAQEGRRGVGRGRPGRGQRPGARAGGRGPGQSVPAPTRDGGRQHPDRQAPRRRGDAQQQ